MKLTLYNIGKTDSSYIVDGIEDYVKRINHFIDFSIIYLPNIKHSKNLGSELICKKEGEMLLKATAKCNFIVLLDEKGKEFSSTGFAKWFSGIMTQSYRDVAFIIGGAYGFSPEVYRKASLKISLSKMTFTHQLARLFFVEQLYRAFTIIKGIPYHNE